MKILKYRGMAACLLALSLLLALVGCSLLPPGDASSAPSESNRDYSDEASRVLDASSESGSASADGDDVSASLPELSPAEKLLDEMTLEEKVAQLFIVRLEQLDGSKKMTSFNGDTLKYGVGGVIFFSKNIQNRDQCTALISALQSASKIPLFVSVDEEGGTVARLANNSKMGTTKFPNMAKITTEEGAFNVGKVIGSEIKELGFNLDFAPVSDVNSNPKNPVIGNRSFGSDPAHVAKQVASAVRGFHSSGMLCTLKHFPGHGDTTTDSHLGYTQLDKTLDELRQTEFVPFASGIGAGADFVMVAHISVPEVTGDDLPATLSPAMIDILRNELGFDGLIITDALEMGAISDRFTSGEAAVKSLLAGTDVLLCPSSLDGAIDGVVKAVNDGTLTVERIEESVLKILELKYANGIIS